MTSFNNKPISAGTRLATMLLVSKESFPGQIKYVYQSSGQFQSSATTIGTYLRSTSTTGHK